MRAKVVLNETQLIYLKRLDAERFDLQSIFLISEVLSLVFDFNADLLRKKAK